MGIKTNKTKSFTTKAQKNRLGVILLSFMLISIIAITLAFYFANDYASKTVVMTGKVDIEAVGQGMTYASIEDRNPNSNLVIYLDSTYDVLIPGMPISLDANCKVYASTTKPLLRAKFDVEIYDNSSNLLDENDTEYTGSSGTTNLYDAFTVMLDDVVTHDSDWILFTDGFYYYIGNHSVNATLGNTVLWEIDVTGGNQVVPFIDRPITFPKEIESGYSGYNVKFIITFEAIQNFIPNASGIQLENTITNSKTIFDDNREGGQDYGGTNTSS